MRLSEEKARHLSHVCFDALVDTEAVELLADDLDVTKHIRNAIMDWLKTDDVVDEAVRRTLSSYSRKLIEGTPEYDVLYQKHYNEELVKRGKL